MKVVMVVAAACAQPQIRMHPEDAAVLHRMEDRFQKMEEKARLGGKLLFEDDDFRTPLPASHSFFETMFGPPPPPPPPQDGEFGPPPPPPPFFARLFGPPPPPPPRNSSDPRQSPPHFLFFPPPSHGPHHGPHQGQFGDHEHHHGPHYRHGPHRHHPPFFARFFGPPPPPPAEEDKGIPRPPPHHDRGFMMVRQFCQEEHDKFCADKRGPFLVTRCLNAHRHELRQICASVVPRHPWRCMLMHFTSMFLLAFITIKLVRCWMRCYRHRELMAQYPGNVTMAVPVQVVPARKSDEIETGQIISAGMTLSPIAIVAKGKESPDVAQI